jgi:hypothetical protein
MNGIANWLERQRPLGLAACCARLTGALLLWAVPVSLMAYQRFEVAGLWASLVAGVVCLVAGLLALVATAVFRGPNAGLWSLAFGLAFRMGLPLGCALYLSRSQPVLADAGVFGLIVAYYLFTLVVETLLSLRLTRHRSAA